MGRPEAGSAAAAASNAARTSAGDAQKPAEASHTHAAPEGSSSGALVWLSRLLWNTTGSLCSRSTCGGAEISSLQGWVGLPQNGSDRLISPCCLLLLRAGCAPAAACPQWQLSAAPPPPGRPGCSCTTQQQQAGTPLFRAAAVRSSNSSSSSSCCCCSTGPSVVHSTVCTPKAARTMQSAATGRTCCLPAADE